MDLTPNSRVVAHGDRWEVRFTQNDQEKIIPCRNPAEGLWLIQRLELFHGQDIKIEGLFRIRKLIERVEL